MKLIDGKVVSDEVFQKQDHNNIYSISVWKGEEAVSKYGNKGKDGVVEITTIKNHNANTNNTRSSMLQSEASSNSTDTASKPLETKFEYDLNLIAPAFLGGTEVWQ